MTVWFIFVCYANYISLWIYEITCQWKLTSALGQKDMSYKHYININNNNLWNYLSMKIDLSFGSKGYVLQALH